MRYANYRWIDVAEGGVDKRNNLQDVAKWRAKPGAGEVYRTVYRYPDTMREHFDIRKSVAGYAGYVYADWLPLDIDDTDLSEAHEMAKSVLNQLLHRYEVNLAELRCYFSGAKGFHVLIPADMLGLTPAKEIPAAFKRLVPSLFDDVKLDTSIYDIVRLLRCNNTVNAKSGLHKIPLTAAEILHTPLSDILAWAEAPRQIETVREVERNEALADLYAQAVKDAQERRTAPKPNGQRREIPKDAKPCIMHLLDGVSEGGRDNAALRLAVHFARQGLPMDVVQGMMTAWNGRNVPALDAKDVQRTVEQAFEGPYDFGCNDDVLKAHCDDRCRFREKGTAPQLIDKIYSIEQAYMAYEEYIRTLQKTKVSLGLGNIDAKMRGVAPGEVCQIIARAGVGKTALVLNILAQAVKQGAVPALFFTMEMPLAQVWERMCQIASEKPGAEVECMTKAYMNDHDDTAKDWMLKTFHVFGHTYFVEDDGLSIDNVKAYCEAAEQRIGERPRLIALDYMGRMDGGRGTVYEQTSRLAKGIKWLAKQLNVAVISLHQISRAGGDGSIPVTMDMCRDSGQVEEAADFILGMWRPRIKEGAVELVENVEVAILKNRKGGLARSTLAFHKQILRMVPTEKEATAND